MLGLFKSKTQKQRLEDKYRKLIEAHYKLSRTNRTLSDQKYAEANNVLEQIEQLERTEQ
jgi:hypothetical protein